jgi:outer membrane cobalamin receptor
MVLLLCFTLLLCHQSLHGISGRVIDQKGEAVVGATISDSRHAVYSASDGSFSIITEADSIYISRIGFHKLALNTHSYLSPITLFTSDILLPTVWVRAVEYKQSSPSLSASIIHPDTNAKIESANELLLANSSFSTTDTKLTGERQTVSLLGSFSRHSLVMLDGVVLNPAGEAFDLSKIPLGQISYIEVIKGNSSVYGGSAAIGGIIHIHTHSALRKPAREAALSSSIGSFGLYKQVYSTSLSKSPLSLSMEYTHHTAANNFPYNTPAFWAAEPELKRVHNKKTADSFYAKSSYLNGGTQIDYSVNAGSFVRQLPGPINFLDLYNDSKLTGDYAQHNLRGMITHNELANELLLWCNTDQSIYKNLFSDLPFGSSHYRQKQLNRGIKGSSNLSTDAAKLGMNAEYSATDYSFYNYINHTEITGMRENTALALRTQRNLFPFYLDYKVLAAVRGDYSDKSLHPTWRIENELSLPIVPQLVIGGFAGTAYSQPSLFDMFWIGDSETFGNPDLKSESSFGYSVYSDFSHAGMKLHLAYYRNYVDDLIQWRQYYLNGVSWKPFNVGSADLQNLELESQLQLYKWLTCSGGISFTAAYDVSQNPDGSHSPTYNKKLVYTPDTKATIKLAIGDVKCGAALQYSYTGEQYSTPDNLIAPLKDFDNLDASLFYRISFPYLDVQLDLKANNILNNRYEIYAYIPQPGFNWSAGVSISTKNYTTNN